MPGLRSQLLCPASAGLAAHVSNTRNTRSSAVVSTAVASAVLEGQHWVLERILGAHTISHCGRSCWMPQTGERRSRPLLHNEEEPQSCSSEPMAMQLLRVLPPLRRRLGSLALARPWVDSTMCAWRWMLRDDCSRCTKVEQCWVANQHSPSSSSPVNLGGGCGGEIELVVASTHHRPTISHRHSTCIHHSAL